MGLSHSPSIVTDGLVLALDAGNRKSSIWLTQQNNLLVDPHTWTVGTGGFTGYGANGDATEQNRTLITDDPWGGTSVVWGTTPDAVSGPDGGWNTSYYPIDQNKLYRYSVWVRRHTAGTGGTFYFGMNPSPIRNDNSTLQGNPYFCYPGLGSLTLNQWYLVVAHCFPQSYRGGRHPDSGWYANGSRISDIAFGNVGSADVRWNPGTTTAMHRAYHYYTTNTASGLQFAFPRIDLCDGKEPSISELLNSGESIIKNMVDINSADKITTENLTTFNYNNLGSFSFDASKVIAVPMTNLRPTSTITQECWFNTTNNITQVFIGSQYGNSSGNSYALWINGANGWTGGVNTGTFNYQTYSSTLSTNTWYHFVHTYDGSNQRLYINGVNVRTWATTGNIIYDTNNTLLAVGNDWNSGYNSGAFIGVIGQMPIARIYNRSLSAEEVAQNFNALRGRYSI